MSIDLSLELVNATNAPGIRSRAKNLMVPTMMPGPKEPDADQIQEYLSIIVDNLIALYEDGIQVPTPSSPEGRLIVHPRLE